MFMVIHAGGMPFNGDTIPSGKSLGGSESAAYYMARELVALGHKVTVFTSSTDTGSWDGVRYEHYGPVSEQFPLGQAFHFYMQAPVDVLVVQRHPAAFLHGAQYNAKLRIFWLHDLALKRTAGPVNATLVQCDKVFTVSNWHKDQVSKTYNIDPEHIFATHNGMDYDALKDLEIKSYDEREPNSLLYSSRPERGLENLVRPGGIMEALPGHKLYVCGYDNTQPNMRAFYEALYARCEELPNVELLGHLGKRELYERENSVLLHVYPTTFEDTSCIVVLEAAACGTPLLGSNWSAVPETAKDSGAKLLNLKNGVVDGDRFVRQVMHLTQKGEWETRHNKALEKHQSWAQAAKGWVEEFIEMFAERTENSDTLVRHFKEHSDFAALKELAPKELPEWAKDEELLKAQNKAHHDYLYKMPHFPWYDPNIKQSPRFKILLQEFLAVDSKAPIVYDIGPSEGAMSLALASVLKDATFIGVDIEERNIDAYMKKAEEMGLKNASCHLHEDDEEENALIAKADVILLGEVLEHMIDPRSYIESLHARAKDGCKFICTTPYGLTDGAPDQASHHVPVHLHHFERADLFDMYGQLSDYNVTAVPTRALLGIYQQGHYVYSWTRRIGEAIGHIDWQRKFLIQAPRQTLSLCMIVKNAQHSIGKCIEKIGPFIDELVIGVDPSTTDKTREAILSLKHPKARLDMFMLDKPVLESGFDAARNQTVERSTKDWILWMDDDESLENGYVLRKYLRANPYYGYLVPQHHYAAFPAEKFKTDYPCRIFRNYRGIHFIGFVHEHPYSAMNKDVGKAIVPNDLAIMHTGYATEEIRRARFNRNFPLIQRDREDNPERILGKMLYLRDLSHVIRYTMERNGGVLTNAMIESANEVVELYREVLNEGGIRMAVDSLPFYSHAVQILGGGIAFAVAIDATKMSPNGGPILGDDKVVQGEFQNQKDIDSLVGLIIKDKTDVFGERYY
jgi:glycosyltransferase involved in cell wall biosynthesis/2-polyprenyl-3-methyl-5-hydroxy-6-metoxy-1,4-benzoquinol methylase